MLWCFFVSGGMKQVSMPFDKMSQAERVKVEQPGAAAKPLLPRPGVCCFGTPTCGSSCRSSRQLLRQAAGKSRYTGSSAEEARSVLTVPEPCHPPFPPPCSGCACTAACLEVAEFRGQQRGPRGHG